MYELGYMNRKYCMIVRLFFVIYMYMDCYCEKEYFNVEYFFKIEFF